MRTPYSAWEWEHRRRRWRRVALRIVAWLLVVVGLTAFWWGLFMVSAFVLGIWKP